MPKAVVYVCDDDEIHFFLVVANAGSGRTQLHGLLIFIITRQSLFVFY